MTDDKYENYRKAALAGGAPADEVERTIKDMADEDAKINARCCPRCGSPISRTLDKRQDGPTAVAGKWFSYRCAVRCGWFVDRCEPVGEN